MECKMFEVRDSMTFVPVMAVRLNPVPVDPPAAMVASRQLIGWEEANRYLLARAGYGRTKDEQRRCVLLCRIVGGGGQCAADPYEWDSRTLTIAHQFVVENWDSLDTGAVIDVQYILGETTAPKLSERDTSL